MNISIRRIWRLSRLALHIGIGLFQASVLFGFYSAAVKDRTVSRWSAKLLRILGIRLDALESPAFDQGALLVANHISWLDIFVILSVKRVHFVAKHEIRSWPVFGWLAHRAGTLFIQRARKSDTVRINQEMHDLLQDGAWVAVFPEGTSTNGSRLLRFLSSLFQPAVTENLPVVPAALQYRTADGRFTDAAAYADNISFGQSLWNITGEKEIFVRLQFCAPILGQDRRQLAETAYREIATCLGFEQTGNPTGALDDLPSAMP
jgi:1-acyl-sn-glycerol-3-phosphate acyltransferase